MENLTKDKSNLIKMLGVLAILACVYLGVRTVSEIKSFKFIGGGAPASNVISFEGEGEVFAKADIALINFTITESAKDMKITQGKVTSKETTVLDFLQKSGIEKKDIKTENYNSYPKYDYQNSVCPPIPLVKTNEAGTRAASPYYCPPGRQVLTSYEVSESMSVKIRDTGKAGDIVKGIGDLGISNISGPNFSIDNEDILKAQARKIAIDEAKAKAEVLAHDLGVRLVRIVSFSENGNYPRPMYESLMAKDGAATAQVAPAPELPAGENKIISNVTITYEIR